MLRDALLDHDSALLLAREFLYDVPVLAGPIRMRRARASTGRGTQDEAGRLVGVGDRAGRPGARARRGGPVVAAPHWGIPSVVSPPRRWITPIGLREDDQVGTPHLAGG